MSYNCQLEHQGKCKVITITNETISKHEQEFMNKAKTHQLFEKEVESLVQAQDELVHQGK